MMNSFIRHLNNFYDLKFYEEKSSLLDFICINFSLGKQIKESLLNIKIYLLALAIINNEQRF